LDKDRESGLGEGVEDRNAWLTLGRFEVHKTMNIEMTGSRSMVAVPCIKKTLSTIYDDGLGSALDDGARLMTRCVTLEGGEGLAGVFKSKGLISAVFDQ